MNKDISSVGHVFDRDIDTDPSPGRIISTLRRSISSYPYINYKDRSLADEMYEGQFYQYLQMVLYDMISTLYFIWISNGIRYCRIFDISLSILF